PWGHRSRARAGSSPRRLPRHLVERIADGALLADRSLVVVVLAHDLLDDAEVLHVGLGEAQRDVGALVGGFGFAHGVSFGAAGVTVTGAPTTKTQRASGSTRANSPHPRMTCLIASCAARVKNSSTVLSVEHQVTSTSTVTWTLALQLITARFLSPP